MEREPDRALKIQRLPFGARQPDSGKLFSAVGSVCSQNLPWRLPFGSRLRAMVHLRHFSVSCKLGIICFLAKVSAKLPLNNRQPRRDVIAIRSRLPQRRFAATAPFHDSFLPSGLGLEVGCSAPPACRRMSARVLPMSQFEARAKARGTIFLLTRFCAGRRLFPSRHFRCGPRIG
jgi:hypothetical protein